MSSNGDSLNWYFELIDEFTSPAEKIIKAVKKLDGAFKSSKKLMKNYIDEFTNLTKKVDDSANSIQKNIRKMSIFSSKRGGNPILNQIFGNTRAIGSISSIGNIFRKVGVSFFKAGNRKNAYGFLKLGRTLKGIPAVLGAIGSGAIAAALAGVGAGLYGCVAAAKAYVAAFQAVASVTWDASKMATAVAAFKESTLIGFKAMLGTRSAAAQIMRDAQAMAQNTNLPLEDVLGSYRQILGAGFKESELPNLFQAFADVMAFNGSDLRIVDQFTDMFGEVRAKGVFEMERLQDILKASGGAIDKNTVMKNIAENLEIGVDQVERALLRGEVTADSGLNAVLRAIQSTGGGKVGLGMLEQANGLGGLIARLVDLPKQLLFGMDFGNSQGFQALKGTLKNILSLFYQADGAGRRVQSSLFKAFDDLFFKLFGNLSGEDGKTKIESVLDKIQSNVEFFWDAFLAGMDGAMAFIKSFFSFLVPTGKKDFKSLSETLKMLGSALGAIAAQTIDILISLVNAFFKVAGLIGSSKLLIKNFGETISNVFSKATSLPDRTSSFFNKLFIERGERVTQDARALNESSGMLDFAAIAVMQNKRTSLMAQGGIVERPTLTVMGEDGPEAIVPLTKSYGQGLSRLSGASPVTVNVSIALDARGNDDSQGIAQRIAAALPSAIADALEGLALESQGAF